MVNIVQQQHSLSAGELSPSFWGRSDHEKYHSGTSTCRNFFSNYRGGVSSRAGLAYINMAKQRYPNPPRLIPFQFSLNQGYALEFGDKYIRFIFQGGYITETPFSVTSISKTNPAKIGVPGNNFAVGDWIFIQDVQGMTNFNGLTWIVSNVLGAGINVTDLFGNTVSSFSPLFNPYISGGTAARIYEITSPYAVEDLPYIKYTQSADTMTLTCVNTITGTEYPPYSLVRHDNADWTLTQEVFEAQITAPTNLTVKAQSSDIPSTWYSYVVTAVNSATGEESVASEIVSIQNNDIALSAGSNSLYWDQVTGASSYNIYSATPSYSITVPVSSVFGFIGTSIGPSFTDTNITPDFTTVPPVHNDPFAQGTINQINITAGGINYSQQTISWSINSVTGSGFDGFPVVANGSVIGFIITNPGKNYSSTDTITFSDSGGGIATGNYTFTGNVSDGDNITVNSVSIKWRQEGSATGSDEVRLGNTVALTIQSMTNFLNSSNDINLTNTVYTNDATHIYFTYKTPGTDGNLFTLSTGSSGHTVRSGPTLTGGGTIGSGATATITVGKASGTYPSLCTYFQQRRVFAASLNKPDTYWMSQPGLFNNMDSSIPVTDGDSITGTPWALQVNGIQFMVPMPGGLVVLTGKGAWQLSGGSSAAITPSNQSAVPQAYNGCNSLVQPIQNNFDIIYVQAKGSIVRDLAYNFFTNIYTGTDLTVLSNHLFTDKTIVQWAWCEEPYKFIWVVRDDGILLCLTYLKEQEVYSWTRHDTDGLFISVCSVTEPPVDAAYFIVQRHIQGGWVYYVERMDDRVWNSIDDVFCVDAGLRNSVNFPEAILTITHASGGNIPFTASAPVFTADNVNDIIRVDGGQYQVVSFIDTTSITCKAIVPLTEIIPNNLDGRPLPAQPGSWSISTPITMVTGLNHLEGEEVTILSDGGVIPNQEVINGSITLPFSASNIVVGLPYTCQVQTLYIDHPSQSGGTTQNQRKLIQSIGLICETSRGLQIGSDQIDASTQPNYATVDWVDMSEQKDRNMFVNAGQAIPLFTGQSYKNVNSSWRVTGQIAVQQVYPLPANILSVIAYWNTGDDI